MDQNILTTAEKKDLEKGYKKRLLIISLWSAALVFVLSIIVLVSPFIFARTKVNGSFLPVTDPNLSGEQEKLLASLKTINEESKMILTFKNNPSVGERMNRIIGMNSASISIEAISYKSGLKKKNPYGIFISGTASDREALVAFQDALKGVDFVESVSVPVSAFAKSKDLEFSAEVTLKNQK